MTIASSAAAAAFALFFLRLLRLSACLDNVHSSHFPKDFLFGTATSSYQIEGAYLEDGKSLSNWDVFTRIPGTTEELMMGAVQMWLMIITTATGYDFGVFCIKKKSSASSFNSVLYKSWLLDVWSIAQREDFAYFAEVCFNVFGDRVKYWVTFNEPNTVVKHGYLSGTYPPAHCSAPFGSCKTGVSAIEPYIAAHNIILSHATATEIYRRKYQVNQGGYIGIAMSIFWYEPLRDIPADQSAVKRALSFATPCSDEVGDDHALITGIKDGQPIGTPTAMPSFFVVPSSMEKAVMYYKGRYNNTPMFITENGYAQYGNLSKKELLNDIERIDYLSSYLSALRSSISKGADVRGYFMWSLIDNFEWLHGYTMRFGVYHVDYETQARTPKLSAQWYKQFLSGLKMVKQEGHQDPRFGHASS
ncbi:hypothetical protein ACLOJK_011371 [Asimina triloba]